MINIKIFGITYGDKKTGFTPYHNTSTEKLWRFENQPMIDIIDNEIHDLHADDLLGILSWRFPKKTGVNEDHLLKLISPYTTDASDFDVINLSTEIFGVHFMDWSDAGHKGIKDFIKRCCKHVHLDYNNDCKHVIYANQFVTRKHIYVDYINTVIKPCLELLEGEMWDEVNKDAGYTRALPGVQYNYIPFILERMFMQYVSTYNIKTYNLL